MSELAAALAELEDLLRRTGQDARADWVAQRRAASEDPGVRAEVRGVLAGMGSLSDIPLVPQPGSGLTQREVEIRRDELLRRLDRLTADEPPPDRPPQMISVGSSSRSRR